MASLLQRSTVRRPDRKQGTELVAVNVGRSGPAGDAAHALAADQVAAASEPANGLHAVDQRVLHHQECSQEA